MSEGRSGVERGQGTPRRLVVFGVTGQLGQELLGRLDDGPWPIAELAGIASASSVGATFECRGTEWDVLSKAPALRGWDLVFICTRGTEALEIVRDCLHAEVPCIDLTGALSGQAEVPMPMRTASEEGGPLPAEEAIGTAPLIGLPSPTALSWAALLRGIGEAAPVTRVVGTVLCSASASGQTGLVALSEESIALFNQSESPAPGPAGQAVAFDVIPGGGIDCDRVQRELVRVFGEGLRVDVASVQVPTFVGEGSSLSIELAEELDRTALERQLSGLEGFTVVAEGLGSRGLAVVEEKTKEPLGPTLRDVAGVDEILVGRIEADASLPAGRGWRLWLASDPLRLAADHAVRVAEARLAVS